MSSDTQIKLTAFVLETLTKLVQQHRERQGHEVKAEVGKLQSFLPAQYRERFNEEFKDCAQLHTFAKFAVSDDLIATNFLPFYSNFVAAQLAAPLDNYIPESIPLSMTITISPEGIGIITFVWGYSMFLRSTNPNQNANH